MTIGRGGEGSTIGRCIQWSVVTLTIGASGGMRPGPPLRLRRCSNECRRPD